MNEPKPIASLSSSLLARKGQAKPAMRPQAYVATPHAPVPSGEHHNPLEDLGWNDMGHDHEPARPRISPASELTPAATVHPIDPAAHDDHAKTPVPAANALPPVVEQQHALAEKVLGSAPAAIEGRKVAAALPATPADAIDEPQYQASDDVRQPAARQPVARQRAEVGSKGKAAFTLRLDADRHLRLRLASAVLNRSAQRLVTDALDAFLNSVNEIESLAGQLPARVGARTR